MKVVAWCLQYMLFRKVLYKTLQLTVHGGCIHGSPSICMGRAFSVLLGKKRDRQRIKIGLQRILKGRLIFLMVYFLLPKTRPQLQYQP